jgi:hypothetical protein
VVVISSKDSVQHQGMSLTMEGTVNLQLSAKSVGVFEAFYNSVKVRMPSSWCFSLPSALIATCGYFVRDQYFLVNLKSSHIFCFSTYPIMRCLLVFILT